MEHLVGPETFEVHYFCAFQFLAKMQSKLEFYN